ncbi:tyrosine-protein kinase CSK-like [Argopecten irradians]|uniref:tyrosine-protein kinase CSK-like n=1 Tax=Argopecten irradians TaxID=31199 RepID=UPI00371B4BB4
MKWLGLTNVLRTRFSIKIIHCHLAARNILLTSSHDAKVAGFGPTKDTVQDGDTGKEKVPIKWMAPECMTSLKQATLESDCETPYPEIRSMEVATKHYEIMKNCWQDKKSSRPKFSAIVQEISSTFRSKWWADYYHTQ